MKLKNIREKSPDFFLFCGQPFKNNIRYGLKKSVSLRMNANKGLGVDLAKASNPL